MTNLAPNSLTNLAPSNLTNLAPSSLTNLAPSSLTNLAPNSLGDVYDLIVDLNGLAVAYLALTPHQAQGLGHSVQGHQLSILVLEVQEQLKACLVPLVGPLQEVGRCRAGEGGERGR